MTTLLLFIAYTLAEITMKTTSGWGGVLIVLSYFLTLVWDAIAIYTIDGVIS